MNKNAENSNAHQKNKLDSKNSQQEDELISLADLFAIIKDRWLYGFAVAALLCGAFAFYMMSRTPIYEGTASILIKAKKNKVVNIDEVMDESLKSGLWEPEINNHIEKLKSSDFLKSVTNSLNHRQVSLICTPLNYTAITTLDVLHELKENLEVKWTPDSLILKIIYKHPSPYIAKFIPNKVSKQYLTYSSDVNTNVNKDATQFLEKQAEQFRQKVDANDRKLQKYREANNLVSLEDNQNIVADRLKSISKAVTEVDIEIQDLNSVMESIDGKKKAQNPNNAIETNTITLQLLDIPYIAKYGIIGDLLADLQKLQTHREVLNERYLRKHPLMLENETNQEAVIKKINSNINRAIKELKNHIAQVSNKRNRLKEELSQAEAEALKLDSMAINYHALLRNLNKDKEMYNQILQRLNETRISSQIDSSNVQIIEQANDIRDPISPNMKKIALASVLIFGLFFVGVPIGVEFLDNRLRTVKDIESFLGTHFIGIIPYIKNISRKQLAHAFNEEAKTDETTPPKDLNHQLSEDFQQIYSSIQMLGTYTEGTVILVTSTIPEEGKSIVAARLAYNFSRHQCKTLLIDLDLRRPVQHQHIDKDNKAGVLKWISLNGTAPTDLEAILKCEQLGLVKLTDNFHILRTGGRTQQPTEIFKNHKFDLLINNIKDEYDRIIIDTPPAGLFPDALLLAEYADKIIYVNKHNYVNRNKVRATINRLKQANDNVSGVIFNQFKGKHSSLGYGYEGGYYYDYKYYRKKYKYES